MDVNFIHTLLDILVHFYHINCILVTGHPDAGNKDDRNMSVKINYTRLSIFMREHVSVCHVSIKIII